MKNGFVPDFGSLWGDLISVSSGEFRVLPLEALCRILLSIRRGSRRSTSGVESGGTNAARASKALLILPRRCPLVSQAEDIGDEDQAYGDAYAGVEKEGHQGGSHE